MEPTTTQQSDPSDIVLQRLDTIEKQLTKRIRYAWVRDILIPLLTVTVLYLGYQLNVADNKRMEAEGKQNLIFKQVELFLSHFADGASKPAVFAALKSLDPEWRNRFIYELSFSLDMAPETWEQIVHMNTVLNFGELQDFRVEIYFSGQASTFATSISSQLKRAGFQGTIVPQMVREQFWSNYGGKPGTNEIRFEHGVENRPAKFLARFLQAKYPVANIKLRQTEDSSRPGSISVWLPYGVRGRSDSP